MIKVNFRHEYNYKSKLSLMEYLMLKFKTGNQSSEITEYVCMKRQNNRYIRMCVLSGM